MNDFIKIALVGVLFLLVIGCVALIMIS